MNGIAWELTHFLLIAPLFDGIDIKNNASVPILV